jgi:predicted  nucleic acid-binding Zn-ribbon protein
MAGSLLMDKEIVIAIIGFITATAGAIRWLISVYWSQASTIEDLRNKNERRNIYDMKESIEDLKKEISMHKNNMRTMQDKLDYIHKRLDKTADDTSGMIKTVNDMMDVMIQKIGVMESQVIQLAKGMVMIKNKTNTSSGGGTVSGQ